MDPKKTRAALIGRFRQVCTERINRLLEMYTSIHVYSDNPEQVDNMMREIHTLKGELRLMGFPQPGRVVHYLEDNLKILRSQGFVDAASFQDLLTEGLDIVSNNVLHGQSFDLDSICKKIAGLQSFEHSSAPHAYSSSKTSKPQNKIATSSITEVVRVSGSKLDVLGNMTGDLFTSYLRIHDLLSVFDGLSSDVQRLNATIKHMQSNPFATLPGDLHPMWHTQKLDHGLSEFRRSFQDRISGFATSLDQIIEQIRHFRLLPISSLFDLYPGAAREMAREKGKQIVVHIRGGYTQVDRSMLDALGEIMLHLIRNAIDHGIETPDERTASKKSKMGNLTLRAKQIGDRILIEVEDDGRGIDIEQIKQVAIDKGVFTPHETGLNETQSILELIFKTGFSTAEETTETSGIGIGLDVVRNKVHELGGAIEARFMPGKGSCFSMEMPTSIAIVRVLLFRADKQIFALLSSYVDRVEKLKSINIIESSTGRTVTHGDRTIPVIDCSDLLQLDFPFSENENTPLIICRQGGRRIAIVVEEVIGERELTLKPLGQYLRGMRGISGAATLEDGSVVLVLHAGFLIEGTGKKTALKKSVASASKDIIPRVLLVEDSLITRELEKSVLTSIGLEVEEAQDGLEAVEKLNQMDFDMVVADVEMPRLDGFELTLQIKQNDRWSHIPVILVTTLGSDDDRRRGIEVGADAYVVKSEFDNQSFVDTILRFLH